MKIAVVGAGIAGLAVAWHLLDLSQASVSVDIFDPIPAGEGVSGSASGLLNPYTSSKAVLSWQGEAMVEEAHVLFTAAATYALRPIVTSKGLLRLALDKDQILFFQKRAEQDPSCDWWNKQEVLKSIPFLHLPENCGALYIKKGLSIDMPLYLKALMQATIRLGAHWKQEAITTPSIFANYDRVVIAMGANVTAFDIFATLPMSKIKGQLLEVAWPSHLPPLPMSVISSTHIVMRPDHRSCLLGATFERDYTDPAPNIQVAKKELLGKVGSLIPELQTAEILSCRSGIRACPSTHKPLLGRLDSRFWFFTGLCAKGLLYHGYLGKHLAAAVLIDEPNYIAPEVYHHIPRE